MNTSIFSSMLTLGVYSRLLNFNTNGTGHSSETDRVARWPWPQVTRVQYRRMWGCTAGCQPHHSWPSTWWRYKHQCSLIHAVPPNLVPEMTYCTSNGTLSSTHALTPYVARLSVVWSVMVMSTRWASIWCVQQQAHPAVCEVARWQELHCVLLTMDWPI